MLLGVNGVVVKGHGSSDAYSFRCTLELARRMAIAEIVNNMKEGLKEYEGN
jgi:fatty acid/phospholipid biosynthesis enzyme